jgi:hypothetical protein
MASCAAHGHETDLEAVLGPSLSRYVCLARSPRRGVRAGWPRALALRPDGPGCLRGARFDAHVRGPRRHPSSSRRDRPMPPATILRRVSGVARVGQRTLPLLRASVEKLRDHPTRARASPAQNALEWRRSERRCAPWPDDLDNACRRRSSGQRLWSCRRFGRTLVDIPVLRPTSMRRHRALCPCLRLPSELNAARRPRHQRDRIATSTTVVRAALTPATRTATLAGVASFMNGTYSGTGTSRREHVQVSLLGQGGRIASVNVLERRHSIQLGSSQPSFRKVFPIERGA